jgi:lysophospholipase L1-like esterase
MPTPDRERPERATDRKDAAGAVAIPWRRKILFILATLVLVGAVQEVAFRLFFPFPEVSNFNRIRYSELDFLGDGYEEAVRGGIGNVVMRFRSGPDGFTFDHRLNLYGFRGPTFSIKPPKGRPRVLFLGDSFVEGQGAGEDGTIPAQFTRALGGGGKVEAINLGVVGAGFNDYVRLARDSVRLLKPDAVLLVVYANDLPSDRMTDEERKPPGRVRRANPFQPRALQVIRRLTHGYPVPKAIPSGPFPFFEAVPAPTNLLTRKEPPPGVAPRIVEAARRGELNPSLLWYASEIEEKLRRDPSIDGGAYEQLERIASLCRQRKVRLAVAYIPAHITVNPAYLDAMREMGADASSPTDLRIDPAYRVQQRHLRDITARLGLPFLDLTDEYILAEKNEGRMYWAYDTHCTPAGYRLAAEACARFWADGTTPRMLTDRDTARIAAGDWHATIR